MNFKNWCFTVSFELFEMKGLSNQSATVNVSFVIVKVTAQQ